MIKHTRDNNVMYAKLDLRVQIEAMIAVPAR
jgi:hypothetical protein